MSAVMEHDQKMVALGQANRIRVLRAQMKAQLVSGEIDVAAVMRDTPWYALDMLVLDLLEACPGIGRDWLRRFNLRAANEWPPVNLLSPLGELSERKKDWLISQVAPHLRAARAQDHIHE